LENSELELPDEVPQDVMDQIMDVDGLFDKIQDAIDNKASEVTCTYDEKYGYPTSILLDKDSTVTDDEFRARITSIEIIQDNNPIDTTKKDYTKTQATLDSQKLVWASQNLATYEFDYTRECSCLPEIQRSKYIQVVDNAISLALYSDDRSEVSANIIAGCPTIDGLFEIIQDAITDENDEIVVTYNTPFGYPETIYLNPKKDVNEDEVTIKVESFTFAVPGDPIPEEPVLGETDIAIKNAQTYLTQAMTLWDSNDFDNYDFQYEHDCFCEAIYHAPKLVSVRNNQIVDVQFLENSELELPDEVPQDVMDQIMDVDGLFDKIQDAIDNKASEVTCTYDEKYGYPTSILLDKDSTVTDDEFRARITSIEIIQDNNPIDTTKKDYTKTQATLDSQKLVWASQNLATYEFDYTRECSCLPEIQRSKYIQVVDNAISLALYSDDRSEVSANIIAGCPTIDGLFEIIQDAITDENDEIVVTYNTPFGYPETIYLNPKKDVNEDEVTIKVESFTFPVPGDPVPGDSVGSDDGRVPGNTTDNVDDGNSSTEPPTESPTESPTSASTHHHMGLAITSSLFLGLWMIVAISGTVTM